jgi:Raf kinase inhibitor-like YbhB/YbcL family protein
LDIFGTAPSSATSQRSAKEEAMPLSIMSPAFADGETIPKKYTRDSDNLSPPLKWTGAPEKTRSFALVVEDPDAPSGTFRHLAIYNIPADRDRLPESIDTGPDHAVRFGLNDFGNASYDGPEPPQGHGPHHYHFRLGALDVPSLPIPTDLDAEAVWREARKHMIEEAELVGIYER